MGKAILLVRVSTQRQDFDEQEKQLYDMAVNDGYADNDIIPICEKESGIKLAEDERKGLNRLKEEVDKGDVSCVYAWEVSRIGRKKKVIFSITEYLSSRKIQLIIKEPYIKLLNPDGTVNDGAETVLTLFAQISESEMRNKQSRWQRTRQRNASIGKWNGGKNIKFGYTLNNENFYIVNEEEANIIKLAYTLYTTTDMGQTALRNELASRGFALSLDRLQKLLSDVGYTGEPYATTVYRGSGKRETGYTIQYPAIISKELFLKAEEKRLKSNVNCFRGQAFYFARGIMRCGLCGHAYLGYKTSKIYCCLAWKHDNKDIPKCYNNLTININLLDSLLWYVAKREYVTEYVPNGGQRLMRLREEKKVIEEKIKVAEFSVPKYTAKLARISDMYVEGIYDKKKYTEKSAQVKAEISEINNSLVTLRESLNRVKELIAEHEGADKQQQMVSIIQEVQKMNDLKRMQEIIRQFIFEVWFVDVDKFVEGLNGKSKMKLIHINLGGGYWEKYYAYNFGNTYLYWDEDKNPIPSENIKIIERKLGRKK